MQRGVLIEHVKFCIISTHHAKISKASNYHIAGHLNDRAKKNNLHFCSEPPHSLKVLQVKLEMSNKDKGPFQLGWASSLLFTHRAKIIKAFNKDFKLTKQLTLSMTPIGWRPQIVFLYFFK